MSELRPPFPEIFAELQAGTAVPFLGSGASLPAELEPWTAEAPSRFPRADELAGALADRVAYPDDAPRDLALVAQYFDGTSGRQSLAAFLRGVFHHELPCLELHQFLARTMSRGVIITTNYDDLLERAFGDRPYDLVVHSVDADSGALDKVLLRRAGSDEVEEHTPKLLPVDGSEHPLIYKMHGTADQQEGNDRFLITEDDYVDFLSRMTRDRAVPAQIMTSLKTSRLLFLGYGLRDWNLRVVLNSLSRKRDARQPARHGPPPSWAIQYDVSAVDRNAWRDRNVHLFQMSLAAFVFELEQVEAGRSDGGQGS